MVKRIDIAKIAQVSTTTVTRVINNNGYVSAEVRKRVTDAIRKIERVLTNIIPFCIRPVLKPLGGWYFTGKGIQYYQIFYVKGVTKGELGDI